MYHGATSFLYSLRETDPNEACCLITDYIKSHRPCGDALDICRNALDVLLTVSSKPEPEGLLMKLFREIRKMFPKYKPAHVTDASWIALERVIDPRWTLDELVPMIYGIQYKQQSVCMLSQLTVMTQYLYPYEIPNNTSCMDAMKACERYVDIHSDRVKFMRTYFEKCVFARPSRPAQLLTSPRYERPVHDAKAIETAHMFVKSLRRLSPEIALSKINDVISKGNLSHAAIAIYDAEIAERMQQQEQLTHRERLPSSAKQPTASTSAMTRRIDPRQLHSMTVETAEYTHMIATMSRIYALPTDKAVEEIIHMMTTIGTPSDLHAICESQLRNLLDKQPSAESVASAVRPRYEHDATLPSTRGQSRHSTCDTTGYVKCVDSLQRQRDEYERLANDNIRMQQLIIQLEADNAEQLKRNESGRDELERLGEERACMQQRIGRLQADNAEQLVRFADERHRMQQHIEQLEADKAGHVENAEQLTIALRERCLEKQRDEITTGKTIAGLRSMVECRQHQLDELYAQYIFERTERHTRLTHVTETQSTSSPAQVKLSQLELQETPHSTRDTANDAVASLQHRCDDPEHIEYKRTRMQQYIDQLETDHTIDVKHIQLLTDDYHALLRKQQYDADVSKQKILHLRDTIRHHQELTHPRAQSASASVVCHKRDTDKAPASPPNQST